MPNDMSGEVFSASIPVPQDAQIVGPATRLLAGVFDLVIDSDAVYEAAASDLSAAKNLKKAIDEDRKGLTRPLDELKAKIMEKYRPAITLCDRAIELIEPKMLSYRREKEAAAEAERQRLEALARQERERLEREAAEVRRKAEEEARAVQVVAEAEAAAARKASAAYAATLAAAGKEKEAKEARARAEAEAIAKKAALDREAAENLQVAADQASAMQAMAQVVAAPPTNIAAPKVSGTSVASTYKARVTDKLAFVQFCAANPMFLNLLDVNESALNAQARSLQTNLAMPGIEVYPDQSIRSTRARSRG